MLKHAFFTDPKDQSPWNYHEWLISLLSPIQVVAVSLEIIEDRTRVIIGLSHKVKNMDKLDVALLDMEGSPVAIEV